MYSRHNFYPCSQHTDAALADQYACSACNRVNRAVHGGAAVRAPAQCEWHQRDPNGAADCLACARALRAAAGRP